MESSLSFSVIVTKTSGFSSSSIALFLRCSLCYCLVENMKEVSLLLDLICLEDLLASGLLISDLERTFLLVGMIVSRELDSSKVLNIETIGTSASSVT